MKLTDLTPKQKRIAIAEACGWKQIRHEDGWWNHRPDGHRYPTNERAPNGMPDYLNDLNAMHEAEKTLDDEQFQKWTDYLFDIQSHDREIDGRRWQWLCSTAAQRADAFLLATGRATV